MYNITMVIEIAFSIYSYPVTSCGTVYCMMARKGNNCEKHYKVLVCIDRLLFDVSNNTTPMNSKHASIFYNVYDMCTIIN